MNAKHHFMSHLFVTAENQTVEVARLDMMMMMMMDIKQTIDSKMVIWDCRVFDANKQFQLSS